MAYGTTLARAYYGAGDYQSRAALRGIGYNASSYYAAGGFFDKVKSLAKKATKALNNPIVGALASAVPFAGPTLAATKLLGGGATSIGNAIAPGYSNIFKGGLLGSTFKAAITPTKQPVARTTLTPFGPLEKNTPRRRRRKASTTRRKRTSSRFRKRRGSSYRRGDWGDNGGRDKRGHFLNDRGGHRHFRKRRRRKGGRGGRVSFTTKDGRRVSFTARGDGDTTEA